MNENQVVQQGVRGCIISVLNTLLAICAMVISANHQHPQHASCRGMLGAGFPVVFICDDWGGGSPTGSWNRIDFVDVANGGIIPAGFFLDFLFYVVLILVIQVVTARLLHKGVTTHDFVWATFIIFAFAFGFIFAFLTIWSSDFYVKNPPVGTPTPVIPSVTSPPSTPNATSTP